MGQPVTQFQILAKNPDEAAKFYGKLFGWKIDANNALGCRAVNTGSTARIQGGIWPAPPEGHAMVQLFIEVADVKLAVDKATGLGARIIIGPQTLPDGDRMAIILDLEGIPFGLVQPKTA